MKKEQIYKFLIENNLTKVQILLAQLFKIKKYSSYFIKEYKVLYKSFLEKLAIDDKLPETQQLIMLFSENYTVLRNALNDEVKNKASLRRALQHLELIEFLFSTAIQSLDKFYYDIDDDELKESFESEIKITGHMNYHTTEFKILAGIPTKNNVNILKAPSNQSNCTPKKRVHFASNLVQIKKIPKIGFADKRRTEIEGFIAHSQIFAQRINKLGDKMKDDTNNAGKKSPGSPEFAP